MQITLTRHAYLPDCTLGTLSVGSLLLQTIERPWIKNPEGQGGMPDESCVPDGTYVVSPYSSAKFPNVFQLVSYPCGVFEHTIPQGQKWGRTHVLIHAANRAKELNGCIAVGMRAWISEGEHAVLESRKALEQLRQVLGNEKHFLLIQPTKGTQ